MKKTHALFLFAAAVMSAVMATPASAQTESDLLRFEWIGGMYYQGVMGEAGFSFDTTPFGGVFIERDGGTFDVDPTFAYGIRTTYRLSRRWSVSGSWMRAQAAYRVQFPAEATDEGNFDLEGLILGVFDQAFGADTLASAASDARIDTYLASVRYEVPALQGWIYPFATVGTGLYKQRSAGNVFRTDYRADIPVAWEQTVAVGIDPVALFGISQFDVEQTNWLVSVGGGLRTSLSQRWGAGLELTDLIQFGADYTDIDASSTPPTDADNFRVFSTTFQGKKGTIHSVAVRLSLNYSFWPKDRPR